MQYLAKKKSVLFALQALEMALQTSSLQAVMYITRHYPTSKRGETHYLYLLLKSDLEAFFLLNSDVPVQPNATWYF